MSRPSTYDRAVINSQLMKLEDELFANMQRHDSIILHVLGLSRIEAGQALFDMIGLDPVADAPAIRALQERVLRHQDLIRWIGGALKTGREAWKMLKQSEQDEIIDELENYSDQPLDSPDEF